MCRRHRAATFACLLLTAGAAACSGSGSGQSPAPSPRDSREPAARADVTLRVTPAPYQLPAGTAREVVLATGPDLLVIGGVTDQGTTTSRVTKLNPVTGQATRVGRLAVPTHDAAGAVLNGRPFVFGGGSADSIAAVQTATGRHGSVAGQLPRVRSDLSALTLAGTAYLVGGYDGATWDRRVLATTDGTHFRTVARLPVLVRYAAVAGLGSTVWVFGGETPTGSTDVIQQVDLGSGGARVVGHLPAPLAGATAFVLGSHVLVAGGAASASQPASGVVFGYDPVGHLVRAVGRLPVPVSNAAAAVVGGTAYLVGGGQGNRPTPAVTELQLASTSAGPVGTGPASPVPTAGDPGAAAPLGSAPAGNEPWLGPPQSTAHLAPGSDPSVLPSDILIADHRNNRLLIVDPQGRVRWLFPTLGDLSAGQSFRAPDDAFFSPDGKYIIATEEDYSVISVISVARHKIIYRYGTPGQPGSASNFLSNPDDAMMMPNGMLITADIKNCRLLLLPPPARRARHPQRIIGQTGSCTHNPPEEFDSPNGAFPAANGDYVVTEINGDWADEMSLSGHVAWTAHPPRVAYPSDTNEVYPGRYLTADYSARGQLVEFDTAGHLLWRFGGLDHPSLALPLPNGDILANDDYHDRVIVIDPLTRRIVWQYGRTGLAGTEPGLLHDPDGVDLVPPDSMMISHATRPAKAG